MSETDVILNRANVALARSQRLVASWLTPKDGGDNGDGDGDGQSQPKPKSEEELQREESDLFTPVPETYGFFFLFPVVVPGILDIVLIGLDWVLVPRYLQSYPMEAGIAQSWIRMMR